MVLVLVTREGRELTLVIAWGWGGGGKGVGWGGGGGEGGLARGNLGGRV